MAELFYDENDPRKKREMKGDKTPIDIAQNAGPSTPVRIDTAVDGYGKEYKKVLHDFGAGRIGKIRPKKGKA